MGDLSLEKVSETYLDVLKEIGNIGAGNAMTALSQMLNCKVDMKVPQVKLLDFNEVGALMGGEEQVMIGVFLGVEGDITGSMMFLVNRTAQNIFSIRSLEIWYSRKVFQRLNFLQCRRSATLSREPI